MSEINLKLKTYDELMFEITRLNTDKYLLEQKLQQKENILKEVREKVNKYPEFNYSNDYMIFRNEIKGILDKEVN